MTQQAVDPRIIRAAAKATLYREDFQLFAENELKIQTKDQKLLLFKLREYQQYLNFKMDEQEKREGWIRQAWLKSRQLGTSTLSQGKVFQRTALRRNANSIVVAHDAGTAQTIFQMAKRFHENLPPWLRPMTRYSTKTELKFDNPSDRLRASRPGLGSTIIITSARNIHSGAGHTFHSVHLSESARYPNAEEIETSTLQAVGLVPGTMIINESTARPDGDWFHEICENARAHKSPYEFEFIGWDKDPTCCAPLHHPDELGRLTSDEKKLIKEHSLTLEQLKWRRLKIAEMRGDEDQFHQEYPLSYEEAWIMPGLNVWPRDQMRVLKGGIKPPLARGDIMPGARFLRSGDGPLAIWEEPQPGCMYDIGADVALGVEGGNYSVAEVTKRPTGEQVAEFIAHVEPGEFADILVPLGYYFNTAQVAVEINSIGYYTNARLSEKYPNVYLWRYYDEIAHHITKKTGWETSHKTKRYMVALGKDRVFRYCATDEHKRYPLVRSQILWNQLWHYMQDEERESYGAAPGHDDDCVMGWLIAQVANDNESFFEMMQGGDKKSEAVSSTGVVEVVEPASMLDDEEIAFLVTAPGGGFYGDIEGWKH